MIDRFGRTISLTTKDGEDIYSADGVTISWPEGVAEVVVLAAFDAQAPEGWTPPLPVPQVISDRQFFQQAAVEGLITQEEALAAVQTGAIPAALQVVVDSISDPDQKFAATMLLSGATQFERHHPLTEVVGQSLGWDAEQIDEFFRQAAQL